MSWEIRTWPAGADRENPPSTTYTHTGAAVIDGGFRFQIRPHGDTEQLEFSPLGLQLPLTPRAQVQVLIDGEDWFYGIAADPPSPRNPETSSLIVLGGREALRVTLMDGVVYRSQGVFQIVRDILARLCPLGIFYSPFLIGDGTGTDVGPALDLFYSPTATLVDVLDGLAKSAGGAWGVNASGVVEFGRPQTGVLTVPYAGQPWARLPVQGREAVTQAVLRVVSAPALPDGAREPTWGPSGLPQTVTSVATHAGHATYFAEASFEAPAGIGLVKQAVPVAGIGSDYDPAPVIDDDDSSRVTIDITTTQRNLAVRSAPARVVGVEVTYTLAPTDDMPADAYSWLFINGGGQVNGTVPSSAQPTTMRVILPPDAAQTGTWVADFVIGAALAMTSTPSVRLYVHRVRFLVVDEVAAATTAASFLQAPFTQPSEVTLNILAPPQPTVTVTGSPDGDVSGPAGLYEYEHLPDGTRTTKVRIGTTGQNQAVRALRYAVRS